MKHMCRFPLRGGRASNNFAGDSAGFISRRGPPLPKGALNKWKDSHFQSFLVKAIFINVCQGLTWRRARLGADGIDNL